MSTHPQNMTVPGVSGQNPCNKNLITGVALSGAKFTSGNHLNTGDHILDSVLRGDHIVTDPDELVVEVKSLHTLGVRYFHWHARNPQTREQSCAPWLYRDLGRALRTWNPEVILSYGGSRNGPEIIKAIREGSEWSRLVQTGLSLEEGGAHFVTIQAAAELKIITDMERQGYIRIDAISGYFELLKPIEEYVPGAQAEDLSIGAYATSGGANYGNSSAKTQMEVLQRAMVERELLALPHEVEWTQLGRSHALTRLALEHLRPGLGNTGRLNITILFGFSPLMPFPLTYREFRHAVDLARSLQRGAGGSALNLTITVGAAVMPKQAAALTAPLDVGRRTGEIVGPLERLVAYACMPDSDVDVVRFGLEDTPYLQQADGRIRAATNLQLAEFVLERLAVHGGTAVTDPARLRDFVRTTGGTAADRSENV